MFINLRVMNSESGSFYETEAFLVGDGCAVYNDGGGLSIEPVAELNGSNDDEKEKIAGMFMEDPTIFDRMSEMAALDFMELCE